MKKLQKFFSFALVLLLVTSVSIPAVSAEPAPVKAVAPAAVIAVPATAEIIVEGIAWAMAGVAALKIAENLGKTWDNTQQGWDQLMKDTGAALENLFHANKWVDATSSEADSFLKTEYYIYTATSGSGDKKNDTLYHKAKRDEITGKVKVNTERISEEDAVKEMKEGRDIFTAKKELAEKLVNRVSEENYNAKPSKFKEKNDFKGLEDINIEIHHAGKEGYYKHYHPKYLPKYQQTNRPHCWWKEWKEL